ncbi:unnamed protein product [Rotaria magnacalcarata]|uniref:Uncharacterized protein n=1 Tax=Rotaria magnacalcarata TaxID=392030 RepID=A0A815JX90_9BILA|nr:unnamed protein product [Rotaria magnacalcarata]CAF4918811.1 unnamed protein product [Rotaria magnacalcarata]
MKIKREDSRIYHQDFQYLITKKQDCTDWSCLLIFLILLIVYILFAIFAFREGSLRRFFLFPTDTQDRLCGVVGARCPTPQMCVEQCPTKFYHYKLLYAQELKLTTNNANRIKRIRSQLSCEKSARSQVENPKISICSLVKERKLCAPYSFPSTVFYGRYIPSIIIQALNVTINQANDVIKNHGGNTTHEDIIPSKESMQTGLKYF